jgi:UDP-N-acetylmuramyl tripeptide synthase
MEAALSASVALARAVGRLSRLRGGGGTSAPGKLLLRLQPRAIGALAKRLELGSVLISATNGKTTTATLAAAVLERAGVRLVHNRAGANMAGGVATALLTAGPPRPGEDRLGLFEVDEMWLSRVTRQLSPRVIVLGNLFRDQLDRYGELEAIADSWAELLALSDAGLALNADDPLVADLGRDRPALYFGIDDDSLALPGLAHAADAKHCRRCGAPYRFEAVYLGHLGHYHCEGCGRRRPDPAVIARDVRLEGVRGSRFLLSTGAGDAEVRLTLPGLYNVYNALAAAALATALELPLEVIAAGLSATQPAFGRGERVAIAVPGSGAPRELRILLVKNPAGANEVLRTLTLEPGRHDLLAVLNDRIADGRDVSWIWDADFELLAPRLRRATCAGTRATDMAARLKYAGVEPGRISVHRRLAEALDAAGADRPSEGAPVYALPTYTAMLELRELLVSRGEAGSAWT